MPYDGALRALAEDALGHISDGDTIGLGSGRAASALARALGRRMKNDGLRVTGVPTSLQIKKVAEEAGIPLAEADQTDVIDVVFDGADQIDAARTVIKGGGGALLRENILFGLARKVIVMADMTKFSRYLSIPVPVEVHPLARNLAAGRLGRMGAATRMRADGRGYPVFTENGNVILDCDFGVIKSPIPLTRRIRQVPGVAESGIFTRRPDIIYKAMAGSRFRAV